MENLPITIFTNTEFGNVRTHTDENATPWFVARDVVSILGYHNTKKAIIDHVDDDEKMDGVMISDTLGRSQRSVFLNESGVYSLILSSKLPQAKRFKRWIASEVLPSIRKHGGYMVIRDNELLDDLIARAMAYAERIVNERKNLQAQFNESSRTGTNRTNKKRPLQKQTGRYHSLESTTDVYKNLFMFYV